MCLETMSVNNISWANTFNYEGIYAIDISNDLLATTLTAFCTFYLIVSFMDCWTS